ncbi:MAG: ABC transporter permease [Anaerolineae bacterium]|nr:ABC transporter permease [Anaerolineae bacterium]
MTDHAGRAERISPGPARAAIPAWRRLQEGAGLLVILIVIVGGMALLSPHFLKPQNLLNLLLASSTMMMIAVFTTMLMIGGGLDLSVGAVAALTGIVIAQFQGTLGIWGAAGLGLVVALLMGLLNGVMVTYVGINAFITTLGSMSLARGLAFVLADGLTVPVYEESFAWLGEGVVLGIPVPVIASFILFILVWFVLRYTTYGRAMYAMGGNAEASHLAGLRVKRYRLLSYVLSGLSAGVAGVFLTSRLYAAAPQAAGDMQLSVIAAVVLGGTSMAGGKGAVLGTLVGVLILGALNNGMVLLSLSSDYQQIVQGVVLLLAVGLDQLRVGGLGRLVRGRAGD